MKSGIVLPIMLLCGSFSANRGVRAVEFEAPPSSVNAEELRDIRDRLSTSLFFKGDLADMIIEAGLQDRLVKLAGRETRSEIRLSLIGWIKHNTDQAAKIYFYLKNRGPGAVKPPEAISYKMPVWEINPHFLELIQGVDRVAKNSAVSDEEMSLAAQRLFEGPQARPEADAPWMPEAGGGAAAQGAGNAGEISYADYRLDPARLERESRILGAWFENVKSTLEAEISGAEKEKGHSPPRGLFNETFSVYQNFVVALSELKGRIKITAAESVKLEALRHSLRKNLGEMETLSVMRRINERARTLPARSAGSRVLKAEARRIEEELKIFLEDLRENPESVKSAGSRLNELEKAFNFWTLRFSVHGRLAELKDRIRGRGFSCVLDKLIFKYLSRFYPLAGYVRLEADLVARAKAIDVSLEGVAAGDYQTAAFFSGGEKRSLAERIFAVENDVARLEIYSRFNRRLQFFFWDVLVNPFGFSPGPKGISGVNKLLF
jgi:hypothetical protein